MRVYPCSYPPRPPAHGRADSDGDDEGDFLRVRSKSKEESEKETEEYRMWLAGQGGSEAKASVHVALEPLQRFWTDPSLSSEDKFLRDYITRQLWREDKEVPTYNEVRVVFISTL